MTTDLPPTSAETSAEALSRSALERLNRLAADLSAALSVQAVADILLSNGLKALGAQGGVLMLLNDRRDALELVGHVGLLPDSVTQFGTIPYKPGLPVTDAMLEDRTVELSSLDERDRLYPGLKGVQAVHQAHVVAPLRFENEVLGGVSIHFEQPRELNEIEHEMLSGLLRQAANAIQRARLLDNFERQRAQLEFLATASEVLASSLDYEQTLSRVTRLAVPLLADWCVLDLLSDDGRRIERVAVEHVDPEKKQLAWEMHEKWPPSLDAPVGVAQVIRSGEPVLTPVITDEMLVAAATMHSPEYLEIVRGLGLRSVMTVPLKASGRALGAITFVAAESDFSYDESDLALARQLADRAGVAVDNAMAFRKAKARSRAAQVLAHIDNGVFLVDRDGRIALWNEAAEIATGISAETVLGRTPEEAVPGWEQIAAQVPVTMLQHSSSVHRTTLPLQLSEDRESWLSISAVRFPDGIVYAFRDVSDEREVERMKSDFVATVSHELRTPLASVYGAALTLQRDDLPAAEGLREKLIEVIVEESERLTSTITDILLASHIDSGKIQLRDEDCDVWPLLENVIASPQPRLPEGMSLVLELGDEGLRVRADRDRLRQVLANLVENAVKYSPDGGIVRVGARVDEHKGSQWVCMYVADQGIGIPASERERVFEKFYRLDPNQTRGVGGTGLGLYICRQLVERLGGTIKVSPGEESRGTLVEVRLPPA